MTAAERARELVSCEDRPGRDHHQSTVIGPRGVRHCTADWGLAAALARAVVRPGARR